MERTLILIKPDGVARGLVGQIVARIEAKGYAIDALDLRSATAAELAAHYAEHEGKPFYQPLVDFMSEGPIVSIIASGQGVIPGFRSLAGATDPTAAAEAALGWYAELREAGYPHRVLRTAAGLVAARDLSR